MGSKAYRNFLPSVTPTAIILALFCVERGFPSKPPPPQHLFHNYVGSSVVTWFATMMLVSVANNRLGPTTAAKARVPTPGALRPGLGSRAEVTQAV